ncbi:MAG TPA: sugar phosphate isomerase/epimerase [Gemmatimonadales bacterium]|nr:sugar phosphate isomerase/epimerase [Gemmatimonadales bacterium]
MNQARGTGDSGWVMPRREFVGVLAAGAAAFSTGPSSLVLDPSSSRLDRIGLQLYTVRDLMKQDFEGTLSRVAAIGYKEVEFAGYFDHTPQQVRAALDRNGLDAPSAHVPYEATGDGWDAVLHTARLIGHRYIVCAWIPEEQRRSADDWQRVGERFNRAAAACRDVGLGFAFHNHSYEFVPLADGRLPYDLLLAGTDPALVRLELDLFWITFGGGDPLAYFTRYPGRFPLVHVKDMKRKPAPDVAAEQVMAEVGQGSIDWGRIFARARDAGIEHYFVEHDQPADPLASIRASYGYLRGLEF